MKEEIWKRFWKLLWRKDVIVQICQNDLMDSSFVYF